MNIFHYNFALKHDGRFRCSVSYMACCFGKSVKLASDFSNAEKEKLSNLTSFSGSNATQCLK